MHPPPLEKVVQTMRNKNRAGAYNEAVQAGEDWWTPAQDKHNPTNSDFLFELCVAYAALGHESDARSCWLEAQTHKDYSKQKASYFQRLFAQLAYQAEQFQSAGDYLVHARANADPDDVELLADLQRLEALIRTESA